MRQISIKELYSSVSGQLQDLPFAITKNGIVIAEVTASRDRAISLDQLPSVYRGLDQQQRQTHTPNWRDLRQSVPKAGK